MKKTYLLDTNIISEFTKEHPNEQVIALYTARKDFCAISAITWQELTRGVNRMPEGKKRNTIQSFIDRLGENAEVIPYDKFSARLCGEMQAAAEKDGRTLPFYDSQIAATAIANGMILVTHNTADFEPLREKAFLHMEDWFLAQSTAVKPALTRQANQR
ncbi:MAG: type II toxin-antitoxin system VapC family toxin [Treponema sp.]|nr:type II toxin-antitoxin system VapC family toxin [Treponema sp.]